MPEMVERAARAALTDLGYANVLNLSDPYHRIITIALSSADVMGMVQAVIEALREPTEAMVEAGGLVPMNDDERWLGTVNSPRCWQAMIDAALAEAENGR